MKAPRALPNHAGIAAYRKVRSTGTHVGLYKADDAGIESDPRTPWATVCIEHGGVVCYETRKAAESYVAHPEQWCPVCQENAGGPEAYPAGKGPLAP
jgi:hypothetical protein